MNAFATDLLARTGDVIAKAGLLVAGGFIGAGSWVIAQAENLPTDLVGGGILTAVGLVALRLVLNAARYERESAKANEERMQRRIEDLEADLATERKRSARLLIAYDQERDLRLGLEAAGAVDRRQTPPRTAAEELVHDEDVEDLAGELGAIRSEIPGHGAEPS